MLLIWQFLLLSLLLLASKKGGGASGPLTWVHPRRLTHPKCPDSLGQCLTCNCTEALQDNFRFVWVYYSVLECFPITLFRYIVNCFLNELQARTRASLIHLYAAGFMQTTLALRFCEMDSFITECDGDDTTTLYLCRMPHSCLIRQISWFLWQGFMKGTMLKMKGQFYIMDENNE